MQSTTSMPPTFVSGLRKCGFTQYPAPVSPWAIGPGRASTGSDVVPGLKLPVATVAVVPPLQLIAEPPVMAIGVGLTGIAVAPCAAAPEATSEMCGSESQ